MISVVRRRFRDGLFGSPPKPRQVYHVNMFRSLSTSFTRKPANQCGRRTTSASAARTPTLFCRCVRLQRARCLPIQSGKRIKLTVMLLAKLDACFPGKLSVNGGDENGASHWRRQDFSLWPRAADIGCRCAVWLPRSMGSTSPM
jgi:hypothetical protein